MTDPTRRLSGDEIAALKFAAHRQLTRWAQQGRLSPDRHAQRAPLARAVRILQDQEFTHGCELHAPSEETPMPDGWHKIERGLFQSADGRWRITNPHKLTTELRHRWLVAERHSSGSGWCMHDGDHATLHEACAYVEGRRSR